MKQIIYILLFVFLQAITAQTTTQNYILTKVYQDASGSTTGTTIQYFDGLGRPTQTVQQGITPKGFDLVSGIVYDAIGRESQKWLPGITTNKDGSYVADFKTPTTASYGGDQNPYLETNYEPSPLNRVEKQWGAGQDWRIAGRSNKINYQTNVANDVVLYQMEGDNLKNTGYYSAAQLYVTKGTDEENHEVYEFKDKQGQIVLKRAIAEAGPHNTYYVYDDFGNLRYVLSPEASDKMSAQTTYSSAGPNTANNPIDQYCYVYKYDDRNRCIAKKLPGADWIYMVYDKADRLILSQDGNQQTTNSASFTKYEALGRIIQTGIVTGVSKKLATEYALYKDIIVTESRTANNEYTNNSIPNANLTVYTINYYDDYNYPGKYDTIAVTAFDHPYLLQSYSAKGLLTGTKVAMLDNPANMLITTFYYDDKARPVQTRSQNQLSGYDYEFFKYNFTGQPLNKRHVHKAYTNAEITEDYSFTYDNAGRLLNTYHKINNGSNILLSSKVYDELGRLDTTILHNGIQKIKYNYNVRGWLKSINSTEFKESLFYQDGVIAGATPAYNGNISVQQWSTKQKGNALCQYAYTYDQLNRLKKAKYSPDELYNEEIGQYDKNGNIKSLVRNGHVFDYWDTFQMIPGVADDLTLEYNGNQLKNVINNVDTEFGSPIFVDKWDENNPIEYLYDKNGNQTADLNKSIAWMKYNFLNLPEKIQFSDGSKSQYLYDAAGVKRQAKYTYAAAPIQIPLGRTDQEYTGAVSGTMTIDYCGNYIYENGTVKRILTPDGFLESRFTSGTFFPSSSRYDYYLKDHLGNTQVCLQSDFLNRPTSPSYTVAQVNSYYPFGQETDANYKNGYDASNQPYLYNGKEIDRMNGLNMLDYGARWYDPTIGRWGVVDPLAEKYPSWSPYVYCFNNPLIYIDPTGQEGVVVSGQPGDHKNREHFLVNGLDRAKTLQNQYNKDGKGENATWIVYNGGDGGYSKETIGKYQELAKEAGVRMVVMTDADKIVDYVNDKTGGDSRSKDLISNFTYIGHATPGDLDVGFVDHGALNLLFNDKIEPSSFSSDAFRSGCTINVVGACRTAVEGNLPGEKSVVDQFSSVVDPKSTIMGSDVRVGYMGGVRSNSQLVNYLGTDGKRVNGHVVVKKGGRR